MSNSAIVAAALIAIVVGALAIWLVPLLQVRLWSKAGISDKNKLAELSVQARSSITQALGGLALIVTLAITAYQANATRRSVQATQKSATANLLLAEQGQVAERFSRAVEQLGASNTDGTAAIDVRTGGLFSLMSIGLDSDASRQPSFLVVAAYVRNNYVPPPQPRPDGCNASFRSQRPDIATALTYVLPALAAKLLEHAPAKMTVLGLRGTKLDGLALDGLTLERFNLKGAKFRDASLNSADFRKAKLALADFDRACLRHADFRGATLKGATFRDARLKGAKFTQDALDQITLTKEQRHDVIVAPG